MDRSLCKCTGMGEKPKTVRRIKKVTNDAVRGIEFLAYIQLTELLD